MDTEALRTFVTIARAGGFSGAGERLGRSQPAISRRIALLEDELRMPVFERLPGGVALSQAGAALLPHAERVLAALEDASAAMAALQAGNGGPVSVAVVGTLAGADLTRALKAFAVRYPKVALTLRTATSLQVSDLVRRGEATFGLRYFEDPSPELENRACAPEALVVVCALDHALAGRRVASLRDLRDEPWLGFPPPERRDERWSGMLLAQFLTRGVADIRFTAVDSLTGQKRLVEAGFGLALMPVSAVAEERAAASLAAITVADLAVSNPVSLITRRGGYVSPAAQALMEAFAA